MTSEASLGLLLAVMVLLAGCVSEPTRDILVVSHGSAADVTVAIFAPDGTELRNGTVALRLGETGLFRVPAGSGTYLLQAWTDEGLHATASVHYQGAGPGETGPVEITLDVWPDRMEWLVLVA